LKAWGVKLSVFCYLALCSPADRERVNRHLQELTVKEPPAVGPSEMRPYVDALQKVSTAQHSAAAAHHAIGSLR
jgi:hypothetical protein